MNEQDVERLTDLFPIEEPDNHHNALVCAYCRPGVEKRLADLAAAHTAAARADGRESLAGEIRALADGWDGWLPIYWRDGRRVLDDIAVTDLTAALRALVAPTGHDGETGEAG